MKIKFEFYKDRSNIYLWSMLENAHLCEVPPSFVGFRLINGGHNNAGATYKQTFLVLVFGCNVSPCHSNQTLATSYLYFTVMLLLLFHLFTLAAPQAVSPSQISLE
jgi:hypothetical protein